MNDPFIVGRSHRVGQICRELHKLLQRHAVLGDHAVQRLALHQFHDYDVNPAGLFDGMNGDDVRMVQAGGRLSFSLESVQATRIGRKNRRQAGSWPVRFLQLAPT